MTAGGVVGAAVGKHPRSETHDHYQYFTVIRITFEYEYHGSWLHDYCYDYHNRFADHYYSYYCKYSAKLRLEILEAKRPYKGLGL